MKAETDVPADGAADEWATLDALKGIDVVRPGSVPIPPLLEYGRVSTEDRQDPKTSRQWQSDKARAFVEPLGAVIVDHRFDAGHSRSVPWSRRPEAARILAELRDPGRGWGALVVGEGTRCWYAQQFSLVEPLFRNFGVDLWIPEVGGRYDHGNPSHRMLMSILGGMSESERQHVQARVRAAQAAQVQNEGRHQGGRPPYGYLTVDGGPHPNPSKAADGKRLRVLEEDPYAAGVVRRIFGEYETGLGYDAIAAGLNAAGIPCPSAHDPSRNTHRSGEAWQGGTVRAILNNPRYTGWAVWGRWGRTEQLLDPDDVSAGNIVRFIRQQQDRIVRSNAPAHPQIVSVAQFTRVQLLMRDKAGSGTRDSARNERNGRPTKHAYALRGLVRCGHCGRKMEGARTTAGTTRYRCTSGVDAPAVDGQPHPGRPSFREDDVICALNGFLAGLFSPARRAKTFEELVDLPEAGPAEHAVESARRRLAQAQRTLRQFQDAIASGADPAAVVAPLNAAHGEVVSAEHALAAARATADGSRRGVRDLEQQIEAIEARFGSVGAAFDATPPDALAPLYQALGVRLVYDPIGKYLEATMDPWEEPPAAEGGEKIGGNKSVRGGT